MTHVTDSISLTVDGIDYSANVRTDMHDGTQVITLKDINGEVVTDMVVDMATESVAVNYFEDNEMIQEGSYCFHEYMDNTTRTLGEWMAATHPSNG